MDGVCTVKSGYLQKQFFAGLFIIFAAFLLSACLPDGNSTTQEKKAEQAKIESTNVAASLSNIAMQMQSRIVSDDAVYASIKSNSWEIDLGALAFPAIGNEKVVFASADAVDQTRAFLCPLDGTETRFVQITWLDTRNNAGAFSMKGIGENAGPLLTALNNKLSSNTVGTFRDNQITLNNGENAVIPSGCGVAARIPNNAPVIVYTIDKPAAPSTRITRTEFQTIACEAPKVGTQLQTRTVSIFKDANTDTITTTATNWENKGDGCALAANISADPMTQTAALAPQVNIGDLTGNAAAGLRNALMQQLATPCVSSKTTKTISPTGQTDAEHLARDAENSNVDTCAEASSIAIAPKPSETDSGTPRTETMTTVCSSAGLVNTGSGTYSGLNGSTTFDPWSGAIVLERLVRVSTNQASTQGDTTGAWKGRSLSCVRTENLTIACDQYYNAALNARNSSANSLDPFASNLPYQFRRTANINGFSNADTLQPNGATYSPDWTLQSGSCGWTETEVTPAPTNCTYPNEFSDPGTRTRAVSVNAEGIASVGAWSPDTARCVQGVDYAVQFQVNVGSCYGASRNRDCHLNFNLRQIFIDHGLSDAAINRFGDVSVAWSSAGPNGLATFNFNTPPGARSVQRTVNRGALRHPGFFVFNSTNDQFVSQDFHGPTGPGSYGNKGYGTQLTYTYSNNNIDIIGYSWGWGSGGTAGNVNGNPITITYPSRRRAN